MKNCVIILYYDVLKYFTLHSHTFKWMYLYFLSLLSLSCSTVPLYSQRPYCFPPCPGLICSSALCPPLPCRFSPCSSSFVFFLSLSSLSCSFLFSSDAGSPCPPLSHCSSGGHSRGVSNLNFESGLV